MADQEKVKKSLKLFKYLSHIFSILFTLLIIWAVISKQDFTYVIAVYALFSVVLLEMKLNVIEKYLKL